HGKETQMRRLILLFAVIVALVAAIGAAGYGAGASVNVRPGGRALFTQNNWFCTNYGTRVQCINGDAHPWAELTATRSGGITVRVRTLSGGGALVRTVHHPAAQGLQPFDEIVYTLSAF